MLPSAVIRIRGRAATPHDHKQTTAGTAHLLVPVERDDRWMSTTLRTMNVSPLARMNAA